MKLLIWLTVCFIVIGFLVLISMKKSMERRVAFAIEGKQVSSKPVVWWIRGAVLWGIASIFLIVWTFAVYT